MSSSRPRPNRAATRWTARIVPAFILCVLVLVTYAMAGRICVQYLYRQRDRHGVAIAILVLYFVWFALTLVSYARVYLSIQLDPGLVPLLRQRGSDTENSGEKRWDNWSRRDPDPEQYHHQWTPPDLNPNSPGLEAFYSKDVFTCEADGRPRWCSECRQWKPDRSHHSRELGRCVRKMDHLCPWVGGMVSETSFNFFTHFVFYATCLCALCLSVSAYCLRQQIVSDQESVDGWVIAVLAVAAFFALFSLGMFLTSCRFIFTNTTNIDMLRKQQTFTLAVLVPHDTPSTLNFQTVTYPLQDAQMSAPEDAAAVAAAAAAATSPRQVAPDDSAQELRDLRAMRTFAILRTKPSENPWDLGRYENWKSVMGTNICDWLLPIRHSPCCNHESMASDYPFGPLLDELKKRHGVLDLVQGQPTNGNAAH